LKNSIKIRVFSERKEIQKKYLYSYRKKRSKSINMVSPFASCTVQSTPKKNYPMEEKKSRRAGEKREKGHRKKKKDWKGGKKKQKGQKKKRAGWRGKGSTGEKEKNRRAGKKKKEREMHVD
jgi:hypothetical protein